MTRYSQKSNNKARWTEPCERTGCESNGGSKQEHPRFAAERDEV